MAKSGDTSTESAVGSAKIGAEETRMGEGKRVGQGVRVGEWARVGEVTVLVIYI